MTISNKFPGDIPYFTPAQDPPAGTPLDLASAPTLYKPLQMRGIKIHNRIGVSPMGMYSAGEDGHATDFHLVHLGQFALKGAGLVFIETTAVEPRGRWSPYDVGLWNDDQIAPIKRIADFIHSQGSHIGIQIAHAGVKASLLPTWTSGTNKSLATEDVGGWPDDVVGPSPIPWADDHAVPKQLTVQEIKEQIQKWKDTAVRAIKAGIDVIEIHASHGALLNNFLSPVSNKRTDEYGGSFENRTRFLFEVIEAIREAIPTSTPLWVRLSATDWLEYTGEPSWDIESSIRLAKLLPAAGVDVLDVTTGGNAAAQRIEISQTFQTDIAGRIRDAVRADGHNLLIAAVGLIRDGSFARALVQEGEDPKADIVLVARQFLREGDLALSMAHELDVNVQWPIQYHRAPPKPTGRPI
ncbi:unnamed protein product [Clonostachys byssicola]|uniref:NADH:flavin oxidoreductase/NADH oxidase N-terminal domain-containing protein n=1 Tax=Clonostachys byssicola TaxID=160290 RepID=A0A9N9UMM5_9HYPO|nr:unnamed protein product [Clonostachys byssicola]